MADSNYAELIAAVVLLITNIATFIKSRSDVGRIEKSREETRTSIYERIAKVEEKVESDRVRLSEGNERFDSIDSQLRTMNSTLSQMLGSMSVIMNLRSKEK